MRYLIILLCTFFLIPSSNAQEFVRELDKKTEKVLLRGHITFDDILKETTCNWLQKGSTTYKPQKAYIDDLSKIWSEYRFVVFAGTWCGDTKDLLPKFYKVLLEAGIDINAVEMYGVNREKQALNIESTLYSITRVPTIIVMQKSREIGRIIESVNTTIEEDLDKIIRSDYEKMQMERSKFMK